MRAIIFSGQGSQYTGMGKELYSNYSIVRETFQEASDATRIDIGKLCFLADGHLLNKTDNLQLALFSLYISIYRLYRKLGHDKPHFLARHSLGELAALTCAESIEFADALKIVKVRGQLMAHAGSIMPGSMLNIWRMPIEEIEELCASVSEHSNYVQIACVNSSEQVVVSGHSQAVYRFKKQAELKGYKTTKLQVSAPFHSSIMAIVHSDFRDALAKYNFRKPKIEVVSGLDAKPLVEEGEISLKVADQLVKPVYWKQVMEFLFQRGVEEVVEIGPKSTLLDMLQTEVGLPKNVTLHSVHRLIPSKEGAFPPITEQHLINQMIRHAASTRNYSNCGDTLEEILAWYSELLQIKSRMARSGANGELLRHALPILVNILKAKDIPEEELQNRVQPIKQHLLQGANGDKHG